MAWPASRRLRRISLLKRRPWWPAESRRSGGQSADKPGAVANTMNGACDRREKEHLCSEYYGATATFIKGECTAQNVPFLEGGCPKEDLVGRCVRGAGGRNENHTLFYAPTTKETAGVLCKGDGAELRDK